MSEPERPSEEEVARDLAEELGKLRVESVLIGALIQISSIGYRRLGLTEDTKEERDLEQTRVAIETMQALIPVLERVVPGELIRDFSSSVANLQLAYAKAASDMSGDRPRTRPKGTTAADEGEPASGTAESTD